MIYELKVCLFKRTFMELQASTAKKISLLKLFSSVAHFFYVEPGLKITVEFTIIDDGQFKQEVANSLVGVHL